MGEDTRQRARGVASGAAESAPTAPHATPAESASPPSTGPARFWRGKRTPLVAAALLSLVGHFAVGPFSFLPGGPDIEIHDQDGELTIPIEAIQSGLDDTSKPPEIAKTPPAGPDVPGAGAGSDGGARDASADAARDGGLPLATKIDAGVALATSDAGAIEDASADASTDGGADSGLDLEAGVAVAGGADGGAPVGSGRDPQAILGGAASVSAGPNNVTLFVNMGVIKTHPEAAKLAPILAAIPQWKQFMSGTAIDPMRDCDWILIMGPSLADTTKDAVFVHYSTSDAIVDGAIGTISKGYAKGGPMDVGVPRVKAWRAYADNGERVFLRPSPGVAVIVPASHATPFAKVLVANPIAPKTRPGEAMSLRALHPGGSISIIPSSITEMRLWVVPRNADGGADVYTEGDCPDATAAAAAANELRDTIQKKNSFGVRLVTAGLLNNVEVTSDGSLVKAHLSASREQIDAVLGLVAGQVGATLPVAPPPPPPPTAPASTTAAPSPSASP